MACLSALAGQRQTVRDFVIRSWDSQDGLPAASVRAVARTSDGYLWVGIGNGLARFDGVRFVNFTTNELPQLDDARITSLLVTRSGHLWVGTESGALARRGAVGFERMTPPAQRRARTTALAEDGAGALWVATRGAGLARWQAGQWQVFTRANGLPAEGVAQVMADSQGQVWAIAGGKVVSFADGRWHEAEELTALDLPPLALAAARGGGVWVGTSADTGGQMGARVFKLAEGMALTEVGDYPWPQNTFHTAMRVLREDAAGRLWVGLATAGLHYQEAGGAWQALIPQAEFSQILVNCLAGDDAGTFWAGLDGAQLDQVRPRVVRMACARRDGSVWVGTDGAGAFRWHDGECTRFGPEEGLGKSYIGTILEARRTNLWVGTSAGALRLGGGPPKVFAGDAGYGGEVVALEEDAEGVMWAAQTGSGLYRLAGERFERAPLGSEPGGVEISSLLAPADGGLWLGALNRGLGFLKNGECRFWSSRDGLPGDMILGLLRDDGGNLWRASDNGLFGWPPSRLLAYRRGESPLALCWQLSVEDGLDSRRCSGLGQPILSRAADGRIWFPNSRALAVFDPAAGLEGDSAAPVLIEEVIVDGQAGLLGTDGVLRVKSSARGYEVHYTAPDLRAPERLRFRYQLQGADADWVAAGQRRAAYYTQLSPGEYEFRVMAGRAGGEWREAASWLRLSVAPRWLERRSVQIAGALAVVVAVALTGWGIERARTRRRLLRAEALQAMKRERQRIARDLHDDLGSDLTEIMLLGELTAAPHNALETVRKHAQAIAARSRQAAAAMDEIVWTVNPRNDSVPRLANRLAEVARRLFDPLPTSLRVEIVDDLPDSPLPAATRHHLFLAAKEALNNAAKHSGAGEVMLRVECVSGWLRLSVEDNGRGFDSDSRLHS